MIYPINLASTAAGCFVVSSSTTTTQRKEKEVSRVTQAKKDEQIKLSAFMFARVTRDANEIAKALDVSPRTIQRLIHNEAFHAELDRWNYQGTATFV